VVQEINVITGMQFQAIVVLQKNDDI